MQKERMVEIKVVVLSGFGPSRFMFLSSSFNEWIALPFALKVFWS